MILSNEARVRVPNVTTPIIKADVTVLSQSHTLDFRNNPRYLARNAARRQSFSNPGHRRKKERVEANQVLTSGGGSISYRPKSVLLPMLAV